MCDIRLPNPNFKIYRDGALAVVMEVALWGFDIHDVIYDRLRVEVERATVRLLLKQGE